MLQFYSIILVTTIKKTSLYHAMRRKKDVKFTQKSIPNMELKIRQQILLLVGKNIVYAIYF